MRTTYVPDEKIPVPSHKAREWASHKWNKRFTASVGRDADLTGVHEVHVTCDGSANDTSSGFSWYEETLDAWCAGGSTRPVHSSSQYAEAHAVLSAAQAFAGVPVVHIYSDCMNVVDTLTRLLLGEPVKTKTADMGWIRELHAAAILLSDSEVTVTWVRGHADHPANHLADRLANWARKTALHNEPMDLTVAERIIVSIHEWEHSLEPLAA